jgi:hypothetical protein
MLQIRIHTYLVLLDPDPHRKYGSGSSSQDIGKIFHTFFTQIHRLFKIKIVGPCLNKYRYDLLTARVLPI